MLFWVRNLLIVFVLVGGGMISPIQAHIVVEEPWHPVAASYRTMLFLGNLQPVPWDLIAEAFNQKHPAATGEKPAKAILVGYAGSPADAITKAITNKDRQALYEATTRGISQLIRKALGDAANNISRTGYANQKILEAQAIYRAFGDFIAQADPNGHKELGLAWLELTSSLGSRGVLGVGAAAADKQVFNRARKSIDKYLVINFEPQHFLPRKNLTPLPETIAAAGGKVKLAAWLPPGTKINDQNPLPKLVLNFEERGIDEQDLPLIAYGDMLFDSPLIFGTPARSLGIACATCHNRSDINQNFFIPGISSQHGTVDVRGSFFNPMFNDHRRNSLDIPSLRGLRFTGPYGRDGRFASLRDFTRNVIVNEFAGMEPTPFMLDALVAYMLEFDFLPNAKLDRQGRLSEIASAAERRGEKLFRKPFAEMDNKSCASCHIPSANFLDRKAHNIGSKKQGYARARDGTFDTPTLLGARFTAPYFHDGSLPTLASVVDWFDARYKLNMTTIERSDLTAYLEAVGDADEPYQKFKGRETTFRLNWDELTTFTTTFNALLPRRDAKHAELMLATVAEDMAADASSMSNLVAKPKVYELADVLQKMRKSIAANDWETTAALWNKFMILRVRYDRDMY